MAVLFKYQQIKSYLNWNSVVKKILKSPVEIMHVSVCLFRWLTLRGCWQCMCCYGSTKAPWFLVFCKTEKWISAKIRGQGRFVLFVSEGSDQKKNSVSNHLSLTFSQQYSAAGF